MPYVTSRLLFHEKIVEEDGSIVEMKIWRIKKSGTNPDGLKYSLFWVKEGKTLVGYDNHHPKGPHRHYGDREESYAFKTIENLVRDFREDMRRIKHESENNQD